MIAAWTNRNRLLASYRKDGVLQIKDLAPAEYVGFVRAPVTDLPCEPDFPGWYKVTFRDYDHRRDYPGVLYEGDVGPVRRFLSDNLCKIDPPRRAYVDFETDSDISPKALHADVPVAGRLLSFAVVGDGVRVATALQDWDELWAEYWKQISEFDQIAAWNGDRFDFRVQELRCQALARRFPKIMEPYWEHRRRLLFVDHMLCFERHHMAPESGDDKTSLKLNDVCQSILGEGKNEFDARHTTDAWHDDRQRLVDYNLQDTVLLEKLEAETGYLELQQTLAEVTLTFANTHGLKPMPQVDGYMLRVAHLRQTHLPSKKPPTGLEEQYEGAFVLPPQKTGVLRTVHVCDFKSLYPTVIRTFNISPETKDLPGCTAFGTGVSFGTYEEGMLSAACREAMNLRDKYKKLAKENPDDKSAERKSKAYKIFNNSMYGVIGSAWSRYYDVQVAESITLGAKHLILETEKAAKERGWSVVYMDTDSLFAMGCTVEEFKSFVTWCNTDLYPRLLDAQGCPREQQCIELDYEKCFDRLVFPVGDKGTPAKKRYFGSYLHYAFKPKTKPEIRGLEYMRGDGARLTRHMQRELIELILGGKDDPEELEEWIKGKTKGAHIRVAEEMDEDVSPGTRIFYVITDGGKSPTVAIPASDYAGEFDRHYYWSKKIYPACMRVLTSAAPTRDWRRWIPKRPKAPLPGQLGLGLT
jgi:DNA polymerase elongation subunit (family B)